ncbi:MAG: hypothetical protein Q7P63_05195 [Verrucomicrobiota bacterium JB022]|nr:hypothetical protein [Verrucomicrobiota bacterium JB022]
MSDVLILSMIVILVGTQFLLGRRSAFNRPPQLKNGKRWCAPELLLAVVGIIREILLCCLAVWVFWNYFRPAWNLPSWGNLLAAAAPVCWSGWKILNLRRVGWDDSGLYESSLLRTRFVEWAQVQRLSFRLCFYQMHSSQGTISADAVDWSQ